MATGMSRTPSAYLSSRRQRAAARRVRRLRRAVIATVALGGLIGATTAIVQTQVSGARGMRAIGRAAAHGEAADQWMDHASAVACTTTTPRHRHRADCWGRTGQAASTTTTAPTATTPPSTAPASTAAPITTPPTTAAPTTAPRSCAPIRITAGCTYSGCYASTSTGTPAVTLATSQPVTLDHARVVAKGSGVQDNINHTSVHDNTVVSTTNYGVGAAGGTDVHLANNLLVNDTLARTGRRITTQSSRRRSPSTT